MNGFSRRCLLLAGVLACAAPGARLFAQASQPLVPSRVLVTSLLSSSVLGDSLARLIQLELETRRVGIVPGEFNGGRQPRDPAGKAWTIESLQALASNLQADALVEIAAVRVDEGVRYRITWSRAPFDIIDNTGRTQQATLEAIAREAAHGLARSGWFATAR